MCTYFKQISGIGNDNYIYNWQSKGLSDERISSITVSNYSVTPLLDYYSTKTRVKLMETVLNKINLYLIMEK